MHIKNVLSLRKHNKYKILAFYANIFTIYYSKLQIQV